MTRVKTPACFVDGVLDGDALGRPVGRLRLAAVQHVDERGLAHLAMADEDRPHALELLGERTVAQSFEVGVDSARALRSCSFESMRPLPFHLPIFTDLAVQPVPYQSIQISKPAFEAPQIGF